MITAQGLRQLGFTSDVDFFLQDDGDGIFIAEWLSDAPQPSEEEIKAAHVEAQSEYDAQQYARDRQSAYPSIQDQLDYIYHNSITKWKSDMIKPVKDKHPKP